MYRLKVLGFFLFKIFVIDRSVLKAYTVIKVRFFFKFTEKKQSTVDKWCCLRLR